MNYLECFGLFLTKQNSTPDIMRRKYPCQSLFLCFSDFPNRWRYYMLIKSDFKSFFPIFSER